MNLSRAEELERYSLGSLLGEGADLQVFEGTDSCTGEAVVIKRAHPTLVSRNIHLNVENRSILQAELRSRIRDKRNLVHLHMLTERDDFDWYFGDHPGHAYSVQVEDRARGIPLFGGVADMVRGHPTELPHNLFVLFPSTTFISPAYEHPSLTVLAVVERLLGEGYLAQDLGPQNVFYSPSSKTSVVIDLGTLATPRPATLRYSPLDLNDILFDLFRQYTTPLPRPKEPDGFFRTREMQLSGTLDRKLKRVCEEYLKAGDGRSDSALKILDRIGRREYVSANEFRTDFREYLANAMTTGIDEATEIAWQQAIQELRTPFWKKFLFDPNNEIT